MDIRLATCSYAEFRPPMGLPVRHTVGAPRYRLPYQLAGNASLLAPTRAMLSLPIDAYTLTYRRNLTAVGVDKIRAELDKIRAGRDVTLVLLCFERLDKPGLWCHRSLFAAFWREQTGQVVPELGAYPGHAHAHEQPSLLDAE